MVRDVLIKGITDSDIRQDILGEIKQDMLLDQVTKYIQAKLQAKQSASHLSGETTTGAVRSSHRRRKFQNTENFKQIPKKDSSATKNLCYMQIHILKTALRQKVQGKMEGAVRKPTGRTVNVHKIKSGNDATAVQRLDWPERNN